MILNFTADGKRVMRRTAMPSRGEDASACEGDPVKGRCYSIC